MTSGPPSLVSVPRLDSEKIVQEVIGNLRHLDKGELKEFLENEDVNLDSMIQDLQEIKNIQSLRELLTTTNRSLAEYNLSIEPKLTAGRERLIESHQNKETLESQFEKNKKILEELSSQYSTDTTMALLQTATAQAEEEAEKTVDKYLDGEMDVETFIQTFHSQKTLHHLRRVKSEKLNELLRKRTAQAQSGYQF